MSVLVIRGPSKLGGEICVRGAKNAALPILLASAIAERPISLENVPVILEDVQVAVEALEFLGCRVEVSGDHAEVRPGEIKSTTMPDEICGRFRSSLLFLGLLAGKCGHARISMPGGCNLGYRKFDLHLDGLRRLGAKVELGESHIEVWADRMVGADIDFYLPTTTGTENIMLAACFAKGRTRIFNANTRPEIADLGAFLNTLGANVSVGNRVVEINGVSEFTGGHHRIMSGWDEALTYIMAAGMTKAEICVKDFSLGHVRSDVGYLRGAGLDLFEWGGNVYVSGKDKTLQSFDLFTAPYPGVNSDMQPLFAAFASQCHGETTITDQRFTDRFQYVNQLQKLGMPIESHGNCAVIQGPARLRGGRVEATDLRCGAALILSALVADGTTEIGNAREIYRGYENLVTRMERLGADIEAVED